MNPTDRLFLLQQWQSVAERLLQIIHQMINHIEMSYLDAVFRDELAGGFGQSGHVEEVHER